MLRIESFEFNKKQKLLKVNGINFDITGVTELYLSFNGYWNLSFIKNDVLYSNEFFEKKTAPDNQVLKTSKK